MKKNIVASICLATLLCIGISVAPKIGEDNESEGVEEVVAPVTTSTLVPKEHHDISALAETKQAVPSILLENYLEDLSTTTTTVIEVPETTTTVVTAPPTTQPPPPPTTAAPVPQSGSGQLGDPYYWGS